MLTSTDPETLRDEVAALVANEIPEGRNLDYKEDFPSKSAKNRQNSPGLLNLDASEFLADVSAFANTAGGTLIYGVPEKKTEDGKNTGLPDSPVGVGGAEPEQLDQKVRTLESLLRTSLDPRVAGIRVVPVPGYERGPVFVVQVPRSFQAPHAVRRSKNFSYHARTTGGSHVMSTSELRAAFLENAGLREGLEGRREDLIRRVAEGQTARPLLDAAKLLIQVVPFSALGPGTFVDVRRLGLNSLRPLGDGGHNHAFCWDGYVAYRDQGEQTGTYALARRDGSLEAVTVSGLELFPDSQRHLSTNGVEREVLQGVPDLLQSLKQLELLPPVAVLVTLCGVKDTKIPARHEGMNAHVLPLQHDVLRLPEVILDDYEADLGRAFRRSFDAMWQAGGRRESPNYNDQGDWCRRGW